MKIPGCITRCSWTKGGFWTSLLTYLWLYWTFNLSYLKQCCACHLILTLLPYMVRKYYIIHQCMTAKPTIRPNLMLDQFILWQTYLSSRHPSLEKNLYPGRQSSASGGDWLGGGWRGRAPTTQRKGVGTCREVLAIHCPLTVTMRRVQRSPSWMPESRHGWATPIFEASCVLVTTSLNILSSPGQPDSPNCPL